MTISTGYDVLGVSVGRDPIGIDAGVKASPSSRPSST